MSNYHRQYTCTQKKKRRPCLSTFCRTWLDFLRFPQLPPLPPLLFPESIICPAVSVHSGTAPNHLITMNVVFHGWPPTRRCGFPLHVGCARSWICEHRGTFGWTFWWQLIAYIIIWQLRKTRHSHTHTPTGDGDRYEYCFWQRWQKIMFQSKRYKRTGARCVKKSWPSDVGSSLCGPLVCLLVWCSLCPFVGNIKSDDHFVNTGKAEAHRSCFVESTSIIFLGSSEAFSRAALDYNTINRITVKAFNPMRLQIWFPWFYRCVCNDGTDTKN